MKEKKRGREIEFTFQWILSICFFRIFQIFLHIFCENWEEKPELTLHSEKRTYKVANKNTFWRVIIFFLLFTFNLQFLLLLLLLPRAHTAASMLQYVLISLFFCCSEFVSIVIEYIIFLHFLSQCRVNFCRMRKNKQKE